MIDHKGPSAAKPQPNRIISRKDAKAAKENGLSFRPRGEIFLRSVALGMTRIGVSLGDFAPWREEFRLRVSQCYIRASERCAAHRVKTFVPFVPSW